MGEVDKTVQKLYSVIDVETTGVYPSCDRVIEIAVITLDQGGQTHDEYTTLINPDRDVGPVHVHGITASDVVNAPFFEEVSGDILERLADKIWVGHNIRFDDTFLRLEYELLGYRLPPTPTVCTLKLSKTIAPKLQSHRLPNCCAHFGIELSDSHYALADARATARLFSTFLGLIPFLRDSILPSSSDLSWPRLSVSSRSCSRQEAQKLKISRKGSYIRSLLERLPSSNTDSAVMVYMELLDRVLEDRKVTTEETEALYKVAREWGISREKADKAHRVYLDNMIIVALADDVITESEMRDLREIAFLLGFDDETLQKNIERVRISNESKKNNRLIPSLKKMGDLAGKSVCFTGAITDTMKGQPINRQMAEMLSTNAGLIVAKGVTKGLDILVLADPESESGKARKAREYGTRLLATSTFWGMIGVAVD
jgi:DNA polymerase-3 subunit epsilon